MIGKCHIIKITAGKESLKFSTIYIICDPLETSILFCKSNGSAYPSALDCCSFNGVSEKSVGLCLGAVLYKNNIFQL